MLRANKKILTILGLSLSLVFFNSCRKNAPETTPKEDKENVKKLFEDAVVQAKDFKNGCAVKNIDNFFNFERGEVRHQTWVDNITRQLKLALDYDYMDRTHKLDFVKHAGTYVWNSSLFTKSATPSDRVIVKGPTGMTQSTNNATIVVSSYTQQRTSYDNEQYWFPNTADIKVQVDNGDCMGLKLEKAVYETGTFMMPTDVKMNLMLAPFDFEITSKKTAPKTYNMSVIASNGGNKKFSVTADVTFADSDFSDFTRDDIEKAVGTITYDDFSLPFTVDIKALGNLVSPNQTQINEAVKVTVEHKSNKIADLTFKKGSRETIIITYKDGTTEDLYSDYKDLVDRLEVVFSEFIRQ